MKLSVIDRLIITQSLLPETGTIEAIKLIIALKNKLVFSQEELLNFKISKPYNNIIEIADVTDDMIVREINFPLTEGEIIFLKNLSTNCSNNGWVTISSLETIEMLLNYNVNPK